MTSKEIKE
uniref:Uncharacterized protein n=1 Tax=Rhizophora mucronata TaxID=61149 RepID=A0A2P2NRV2_RHIMU